MSNEKEQTGGERAGKIAAAENWFESVGEYFISERFAQVCEDPRELEAVKVERWTDGSMHRILIDPDLIDKDQMTIERLKSDLQYLQKLVDTNPKGLARLVDALGDTEKVAELGIELGLTEEDFKAANGGWVWLIVIPIVLALSGCKEKPAEQPRVCGNMGPQGYLCSKRPHNTGKHKNQYKSFVWD